MFYDEIKDKCFFADQIYGSFENATKKIVWCLVNQSVDNRHFYEFFSLKIHFEFIHFRSYKFEMS